MNPNTSTAWGLYFKIPMDAFNEAISKGFLSIIETDPHYAGNYMYMCSDHEGDSFKHRDTREYLVVSK